MAVEPEWVLETPDPEDTRRLEAELSCSTLLAKLLANREFTDPATAQTYLEAPLDALHDPAGLPDLSPAVDRLRRAVTEDEQIVIYADRDIDGLSGCAIVLNLLTAHGANVGWYVPGKYDGYGLSVDAVDELATRNTALLLTVDCGTKASEAIQRATTRGMDVVVTDHHDPDGIPDEALACVNPRRPMSDYPTNNLAGGGVAFKLGQALEESLPETDLAAYYQYALPLAALATVGDYMDLTVENRVFVTEGFDRLDECGLTGLEETADHCGVDSIRDLRWSLVPLLNASQEDESGDLLLKLFFAEDTDRISHLISLLEDYQDDRREQRRQRKAHLRECFHREYGDTAEDRLLYTVETEEYVGGPAMSSLSTRWGRPVITYREYDGSYRGGGRSDPDVDFLELYDACESLLEDYWGHPGAAGFVVSAEDLDSLEDQLQTTVTERYSPADLRPKLEIDESLQVGDIDSELLELVEQLRPYGPGNDEPIFLVEALEIESVDRFGTDRSHLRLEPTVEELSLVWWNGAAQVSDIESESHYDFVGTLEWDDYRDQPQLSISAGRPQGASANL